MKPNDVKNIVGFLLPTVKDMKSIKENGLKTWIIVFIIKIIGFIIIGWCLIEVFGFHAGIGK